MNYQNPTIRTAASSRGFTFLKIHQYLRLGPRAELSSSLGLVARKTQTLFSHVFVRCEASIFLICMCYAQTISCSSKKGKALFIRSSKLFDFTPPIKTDDESLGCGRFSSGFLFTPQGGRQVGNRKHDCTVLWIFKAKSHMGHFSQCRILQKGSLAQKRGGRSRRP